MLFCNNREFLKTKTSVKTIVKLLFAEYCVIVKYNYYDDLEKWFISYISTNLT